MIYHEKWVFGRTNDFQKQKLLDKCFMGDQNAIVFDKPYVILFVAYSVMFINMNRILLHLTVVAKNCIFQRDILRLSKPEAMLLSYHVDQLFCRHKVYICWLIPSMNINFLPPWAPLFTWISWNSSMVMIWIISHIHVKEWEVITHACTTLKLIFPWTNWLLFHKRCFQMHFRKLKVLFWFKFHWSLFPSVQLTITQHRFR